MWKVPKVVSSWKFKILQFIDSQKTFQLVRNNVER